MKRLTCQGTKICFWVVGCNQILWGLKVIVVAGVGTTPTPVNYRAAPTIGQGCGPQGRSKYRPRHRLPGAHRYLPSIIQRPDLEGPRAKSPDKSGFLLGSQLGHEALLRRRQPTQRTFPVLGDDPSQHRSGALRATFMPHSRSWRPGDLLVADAETLGQGRIIEPGQDRGGRPPIGLLLQSLHVVIGLIVQHEELDRQPLARRRR